MSGREFRVEQYLPGGLLVSATGVTPGEVDLCFDCSQAFARGTSDALLVEDGPVEYVMHRHCAELRSRDRLRYVDEAEHSGALAKLSDAVGALLEVNSPGGEHAELIDALGDAYRAYVSLVGEAAQ